MRHIVVGVGGGIAAYKVCQLVRLCSEAGHDVRVLPTHAALRFVGEATWAALSGHRVAADVWADVHEVPHVRIGREADLIVVAPATADLLARAAHGLADDLLTSTLLTARCPVIFAPAMHTEMWEHSATRANVGLLRQRGAVVLEPSEGRLTGADTGKGRLPEPEELFGVVEAGLRDADHSVHPDLAGRSVVVSAGGTREFVDPVRFIGNRSSGRQGLALAAAAVARGAEVTLVTAHGPSQLPAPAGVRVVPVVSTRDMRDAVVQASEAADAVVMAAAPADYRPTEVAAHKIKKERDAAPVITLEQNPDILAELGRSRPKPETVIVGFAAETGDADGSVLDHAHHKLKRKGADLLVVNEVGATKGFESDENEAVVLAADGSQTAIPYGSKNLLAHQVWDLVVARWVS